MHEQATSAQPDRPAPLVLPCATASRRACRAWSCARSSGWLTSAPAAGWQRRSVSMLSWRHAARRRWVVLGRSAAARVAFAVGLAQRDSLQAGVLRPASGCPPASLCPGSPRLRMQLPLPVEVKAKASGAGGEGGNSAPRKRGPRPSRKEAEENAVRRVSLIRNEAGRVCVWHACLGQLVGRAYQAGKQHQWPTAGVRGAACHRSTLPLQACCASPIGRGHPAAASAPPQVLDGIVRQVEMDEVRAIGLEHKARLKAEKQAERDRRRADKER